MIEVRRPAAAGERASIGEQPGAHVHSPPPFRGRTYAVERPGRQVAALARSRSFATEIGDVIEALEWRGPSLITSVHRFGRLPTQ